MKIYNCLLLLPVFWKTQRSDAIFPFYGGVFENNYIILKHYLLGLHDVRLNWDIWATLPTTGSNLLTCQLLQSMFVERTTFSHLYKIKRPKILQIFSLMQTKNSLEPDSIEEKCSTLNRDCKPNGNQSKVNRTHRKFKEISNKTKPKKTQPKNFRQRRTHHSYLICCMVVRENSQLFLSKKKLLFHTICFKLFIFISFRQY